MNSRRFNVDWVLALAGLALVVGFGVFSYRQGPFHGLSVCGQCGVIRDSTEWQAPFTQITFFRRSSVRDTPVSITLTTNQIVKAHSHRWVFLQGLGNGVKAVGTAHMVRSTIESAQIAQLIAALERYGERRFRDKIVASVFD